MVKTKTIKEEYLTDVILGVLICTQVYFEMYIKKTILKPNCLPAGHYKRFAYCSRHVHPATDDHVTELN